MAKNSIEVLEVCQVSPCINSTSPLVEFTLPLTHFDIIWLKMHPTDRVFFYPLGEHESTHTFFRSVIFPKLKHSLSVTLNHFFPITGNIIWPVDIVKPYILYTPNDSVSLIVAESNSDFNRLSQSEMQGVVSLHPYIPELPVFDSKAAIIAFQITFFPSQGFSVGISTHHAIFDGKSVAMFMRSWALICKENFDVTTLLPVELTPSFDRTKVDELQGLTMFLLNKILSSSDSNPKSLRIPRVTREVGNLVRANFEISRQDISNLRRKIVCWLNEEGGKDSKDIHLSTFVVSYAYIIVTIVKAKQLERKGKVGFLFPGDCRSRLDPPLPTNYFGSCIVGNFALFDTETILEKSGIASVANELGKMVKEFGIRVKNMSSEREIDNILKFEKIMKVADAIIGVAGSPRFRIYGTDFGWGKPYKMQVVSIEKTSGISMAESKDGNDGIEIGLVLENNEMDMFASLFVNGLKDIKPITDTSG